MSNKYSVIVPFYNEDKHLEVFINSLIYQTYLPHKVVFVDDNSTDSSALIVKDYSLKYPFIEYVFHESGSFKVQGKKVITAFNYGVDLINLDEYLFISKIDADLELPKNYFQLVFEVFSKCPNVGITGGRIIEKRGEVWESTIQADYHIRGALKSYRVSCFQGIGGLLPVLGWDGLDEMKAMFLGWETKIIDVDVKHFRPAASDYNYKELNFKLGFANYCNGANLFLALVRAGVRSFRKLNFFIFYYFISGYLSAKFSNHPKNVSPSLARFINKFHFRRIFSNVF